MRYPVSLLDRKEMECNVSCPILPSKYAENWGLDDPSGKSDEVFAETIRKIEENIKR